MQRADPTSKVAVATVLYEPVVEMLDDLLPPIVADNLRLFVFLNGPVSAAVERRLDALNNACILRSTANVGLGAGLNAVVRAADSEGMSHVLLLDQDSSPRIGLCAALRELHDVSADRVSVVGPVLVPPDDAYLPMRYFRRTRAKPVSDVDFLPTSGSLLSLAAWRDVGPFREDYFIDGIDVEWCFRAWSRGYSCLLAENLTMVHRWGSATTDRRPQILRQSDVRTYYYIRNAMSGLRLAYIPLRWKARVVCRLAMQSLLLMFNGRAALVGKAMADGWSGRLGPASEKIAIGK